MQFIKQQDLIDGTAAGYLQISRQNQQLLLYLFVTFIIILSWVFGTLELSFLWTFGLITITFVVWKAKVMRLTEEHIRHEEAIVHRKRALRGHCETSEWLNFLINRWWVFSSGSIEDLIKKHLNPLLLSMKPKFIDSIVLKSFTLGNSTPCIRYLKVFEDGGGGASRDREGTIQASWQNIVQPPPGLPQLGHYLVVLEGDVNLQCEEFKMVFSARLGGKWMGLTVDVVVEKMHIDGTMQFTLNMNSDAAFPHVSHAVLSFKERPEVWFSVRVLKAFQMMEVPVLKTWIHSLVMDALTQALVDPAKLEIKVASTGPGTLLPAKNKSKKLAEGVLTISVSGDSKGGVFSDDVRYCTLILGDQKEYTKQAKGLQRWQDVCSFLVHDLKEEKLLVKSKGKRMFTTYTIADFEMVLANYPFEHQSCHEQHLEKKVSKWESGGTLELDVKMEYSPLPQVDLNNPDLEENVAAVQDVAGVMYVCVHSARNLLALDRTGTSDPYCIIFNNGHKVKTTHYVCSTRNPDWETNMEFLVGDFTKTVLSFIVYDWDGHDASESDFLGSAFCVLSPEEPCVVRRSLVLSYLMNVGAVEAKLGSITVSAVFRPVAAVARAELKRISAGHIDVQDKNRNIISKMIKELKKTPSVLPSVGDMLLGHGILELNIVRGIDLVSKDSNGFSDPFFEVKVGNERKFTSSIKRKTLNPVWDEWVTLQMPGPGEILEVVVWDKDPLFKKDFLGCLTFSSEDLKRYSSDKDSHLFTLQRIASGQIEMHLQVMTEDTCNSRYSCDVDQAGSPAYSVTDFADSASVSYSTSPSRRSESGPNPDDLPTVKVNGLETFREDSQVKATLERTGSFKLERTQSFNSGSSFRNRFRKLSGQKSSPGTLSRTPSGQIGNNFYNVTGRLLKVKGLHGTEGKIYCKVRIDNRDAVHRRKRVSQGHVLAKSPITESSREVSFDLSFDVDRKVGVLQEALLIFDIKHSKRSHLATKGFPLQDLFNDATDITKLLNLTQTIQMEVSLTRR